MHLIHLALHWVSSQEPPISGQALPSANCATNPPHNPTRPTNKIQQLSGQTLTFRFPNPSQLGKQTNPHTVNANHECRPIWHQWHQQSAISKREIRRHCQLLVFVHVVSCQGCLEVEASMLLPYPSPTTQCTHFHEGFSGTFRSVGLPSNSPDLHVWPLSPPTTHMTGLRQQARVSPPLGQPATPACPKPGCLSGSRPITGACEGREGCPSACLLTPRHGHMRCEGCLSA